MSRSTELCDLQGAFTVSERESESNFTWEIVLFILKIFLDIYVLSKRSRFQYHFHSVWMLATAEILK